MPTNDRWSALSMKDKADLIKLMVENGITSLDDMRLYYNGGNLFDSGGKIHIKPENRGKFTALKERTGHSTSWFKTHGTPAQKKMAVFAANAKKWHHGDGGFLDEDNNIYWPGGPLKQRQKMYNFVKDKIIQQAQAEQMATQPKMGEQPLQPLEYDIASNLTEVGDIEVGEQIVKNLKEGNLKSAAVNTAIMALPAVVGKSARNIVKNNKEIKRLRANSSLQDMFTGQKTIDSGVTDAKGIASVDDLFTEGRTSRNGMLGFDRIDYGLPREYIRLNYPEINLDEVTGKRIHGDYFAAANAQGVDFSPLIKQMQKAQKARNKAYSRLVRGIKTETPGTVVPEKPYILFTGNPMSNSWQGDNKISLGMLPFGDDYLEAGFKPMSIENVVGHETAHIHPTYNTRIEQGLAESKDSPFYGMDYSKIPIEHKKLLWPHNPKSKHDMELAEAYSDLWGLRMDLDAMGINSGARKYNLLDVYRAKLKSMGKGQGIRYLDYHSPFRTVRALNTIKANGGNLFDWDEEFPIIRYE